MKTILKLEEVQEQLSHCEYENCQKDNEGQLVFYSSIFEWRNGTFHTRPDPDYNK